MFTGIIEATGRIGRITRIPGGSRLRIESAGYGAELSLGDSVAVDGVCLTVVARSRGWFDAEISPETARRTTLGRARAGRRVNLERPLAASGRLGGHFVQGHVDGTAPVQSVRRSREFVEMDFAVPAGLRRYMVEKGSVAVNGVSLTIAALKRGAFTVALIPHTLDATNLSGLRAGTPVNIEVDILAKYVKALLQGDEVPGR